MKTLWMCSSWWFQNIEKYTTPYEFDKTYSPEAYPKYDDYDAIEISTYKNIPKDYDGWMGVPISSIKALDNDLFIIDRIFTPKLNGKTTFKRLMIQRKTPTTD